MTEETRYLVTNLSDLDHPVGSDYNAKTLVGKENALPIMLPAGHVVTEVELQLRNGKVVPNKTTMGVDCEEELSSGHLCVGVSQTTPAVDGLPATNIDFGKFEVDVLNDGNVHHLQALNNYVEGAGHNSRVAFAKPLELRIRRTGCSLGSPPKQWISGDVYVVVKHKPISVGPQVHVQSNALFMPTN